MWESRASVMIMAVSFRATRVRIVMVSVLIAWAIALAACGSRQREAPQPTASEPPSQPQAVSHGQDVRTVIAAFGDSISAGFGVEPGKSYPDDLQRLIDQGHYSYRVVNEGVSGDTTADGVERLPSVL